MKYLKVSLFAFICAIVFALTAGILNVLPVFWLSILSALVCLVFFIAWVCASIFHRFKHSLNVIMIIIFGTLATVAYVFQPQAIQIEYLSDFANVHYISIIFVVSALACCVSILVLIAQLIFARRDALPSESEILNSPTVDPFENGDTAETPQK